MSLDVASLRHSFELVTSRQPERARRFYEILFARHPRSAPLFSRNAPARRNQMLTEAMVALMDHLEDAGWLTSALPALGAKHDAYGVTEEMYGWVGECLLETFAEVAGDDWTPALARAWSDAYGAIAGLMLGGARTARACAA